MEADVLCLKVCDTGGSGWNILALPPQQKAGIWTPSPPLLGPCRFRVVGEAGKEGLG